MARTAAALPAFLMMLATPTFAQPPQTASGPAAPARGCKVTRSGVAASGPDGTPASRVIFDKLYRLQLGDDISIRTFDGRRCTGEFLVISGDTIQMHKAAQVTSLRLADVRLVQREQPLGPLLLEGVKYGSLYGGLSLGLVCARLGAAIGAGDAYVARAALACGAIGAGLGVVAGVAAGLLTDALDRPDRMYERRSAGKVENTIGLEPLLAASGGGVRIRVQW